LQRDEADRILMALDGVMAYLDTIRSLVKSSISVPEQIDFAPVVSSDPDVCEHPNAVEVQTLGEQHMVCHACGQVWAC
jgi:hypothetical protein